LVKWVSRKTEIIHVIIREWIEHYNCESGVLVDCWFCRLFDDWFACVADSGQYLGVLHNRVDSDILPQDTQQHEGHGTT